MKGENRLYNLSISELKKVLNTDLNAGLDYKEVDNRLDRIGFNQLPNKGSNSILSLLLEQFQDFMVLVLIAATIISFALGEMADAITILAIIVLNAIMGFVQEFRAEKSLESLKELSAPNARVLRNGDIEDVPAKELVPGDIILIERGDKIPADSRIIEGTNLEANEASLTGESVPATKESTVLSGETPVGDRKNMLHMGTTITKGRGKAVITSTGLGTEMGQIADLLQHSSTDLTPLQKRLKDLGKWLVFVCLIACLAVVGLGIFKGEPIYKMFLAGVSLAVAAIPEGLPAIVTLSLAIGVQKMIKRNAIIRKLPAVETLGCATVICSDKTGTLTKNEMIVEQIYANNKVYYCQAEGFDQPNLEKTLEIGVVCNNAQLKKPNSLSERIKEIKDAMLNNNKKREVVGDPTEGALLLAGDKIGLDKADLEDDFSERLEIPFNSTRKRMSVIAKQRNKYQLYIKGAPDVLIDRCTHYLDQGEVKRLTKKKKKEIMAANHNLASQALRVLALGYREIKGRLDRDNLEKYEEKIIFTGLVGMMDPPRSEVKGAILRCKRAGISPKMVTGDHKDTAVAIAKKLKLLQSGDRVVTGLELDEMSDESLAQEIDNIAVFARVSPQDKLRIVDILQDKGDIVAMTGDGVNDAPAIKEADIGIAMGEKGTDVTQEASSLVLADDNFATIVAAIEEGRAIYDNIRKFIRYLLSCNIGEILTMFMASLLSLPLPLVPIQILWVNLVTDGLPALALGVDPADDDIMERTPRDADESVFARGLKWKIMGQGILIGLGTLLVFLFGLNFSGSLAKARTMAFTNLVMAQLFFVFSCRSEEHSLLRMNPLSNLYLLGAVLLSFGLHWIVLYFPFFQDLFKTTLLNKGEWSVILLVSGGSTLIVEIAQFITNLIQGQIFMVGYEE
ncbi:sarco/endoplasmic reticulum calcium-translocating P-type ATPase [Halobacteroides halobius DSM 5150]|uniref:P-type Ca(2+) transporter n=1 Tax=Halobacteroides halobius (strain ATCC 35273 / DSM 5150 / MD-1) TaxID=748449 RepID=L0KAE9_HALHC|nr:calcium-translocating P-type ATPase, SERCA-type [Halobacteroides halobius]AGB41078.1 sarco/endoplasmic reticulum calcium-translocating P-type ATPase [Halobacteroides halobius DSM 5150]